MLRLSLEFQAYIAWCEKKENMPAFDEVNSVVEEELCCPISTTLPKIPVDLFGQIYDLDSISKPVADNKEVRELTIKEHVLTREPIKDPTAQIKPMPQSIRNLISKERHRLAKATLPSAAPVKQANPPVVAPPPPPPSLPNPAPASSNAGTKSEPVPFPSKFVDMGPPVKSHHVDPPSKNAFSILTNGLTRDQLNDLLMNATSYKEKFALSTEFYLLNGEHFWAVRQAEAYLHDVDLSRATPVDKKVCKLLMHAYNRDIFTYKNEARAHAARVIHYVDDASYEANLVFAECCLDQGNNAEAAERGTKFLGLNRDKETEHFKFYDLAYEGKKERQPTDGWDYIRALEVIATAYKNLGNVEQAGWYAQCAILKYRKLHHEPNRPLLIMAWVHMQQGNPADALNCLRDNWETFSYSDSTCLHIRALIATNALDKAVELGEYALNHSNHKNNREIGMALLSAYRQAPNTYQEKMNKLVSQLSTPSFFAATPANASAAARLEERPNLRLG